MNTAMQNVEYATKRYASARAELGERLAKLRDEQEASKRRLMQGIKNALGRFTAAHDELKSTLLESQSEFTKPKTRVFENIKVGFMKQPGKISFADPARTIALIEKLMPQQAELLIDTKKKPIKPALGKLPATDLKKLGVSVGDDTDEPFIKATDGDIDKLIDALINDDEVEEARE